MDRARPPQPWLSIIGIGEDGLQGLSARARAALSSAAIVYGGRRHLSLAAVAIAGEARAWPSPFEGAYAEIAALAGRPVAVLASGDPFHYGVGSILAARLPPGAFVGYPKASSFSLAAARLGWAIQDVACLSAHARPAGIVLRHLRPGARLLVLAHDGDTLAEIAAMLAEAGHSDARLVALAHLEGPEETIAAHDVASAGVARTADLAVIAVEIPAGSRGDALPLSPGLPDRRFENDGQLTRAPQRAMTIAALAPSPGGLLWDVGAGSGSVAIEWCLAHPANRALAFERDPQRAARIARNAARHGVALAIVPGEAPASLAGASTPDAVFVGGGVSIPGLIDACFGALRPGGRLVANAVTIEGEATLIEARRRLGGELTRHGLDRLDEVGRFTAWRPAMAVVQYAVAKP
jgi:precorrin-6Y C5,15-methyltransferase (decarboxylating)